jgi:hypothetical protein
MSIAPATHARIEGAHRFGALYRGYLANHLPMALVALDGMGASEAQIARFQSGYESRLEPLQPALEAIVPGDEDRYLGVAQAFAPWVEYFTHRIEGDGAAIVLSQWADRLAGAMGSGAFHGAIRTAYALESGSQRELAHALGLWASVFEPAIPAVQACGTLSPTQALASIARETQNAGRNYPGVNIAQRTKNAASEPQFAALASRVDPARLHTDSLATALIGAYAASGNFTILHGVTGCHAFRMLAPHLRDEPAALAQFWNAIVAAYLGCGSPAVEGWGLEGSESCDWREIHRRAVACDDEHDVKLAYTCWREGAHYGNDLYRRVASAVVCAAQREAMPC